jgi:cell division protein ZapA
LSDLTSVTVKIFGEEYHIRSKDDHAYVQNVADYLDGKMREIAASGAVMAPTKIAILAALNITDELFRLRQDHISEEESVNKMVTDLIQLLEHELPS